MSMKINSPQSGNDLSGGIPDIFKLPSGSGDDRAVSAQMGPSLLRILAHSAEELTFQFSALREQSSKELDTKFAVGASWSRVVRIEKIRELFEQITGESVTGLGDRAKKLLERLAGSKDAYDAIREMETDPTMQYLILREAGHQAARDPIVSRAIETAIELVQDAYPGAPSRIKADMASAPAIAATTPDVRLRALLRETYRDALVVADTPAEMALHLLEKYPEEDIPRAMRTLARAAADDLKSGLASRQPAKLEAILNDLKSIQTINSALAAANKALRAVVSNGGMVKRSVVRVATDLIRLAHLNPAERFVTDVLLGHVDGEKTLKLRYLASCAQVFNAFPTSIWPEEESKEAWLNCISEYLNREDPRELKAV